MSAKATIAKYRFETLSSALSLTAVIIIVFGIICELTGNANLFLLLPGEKVIKFNTLVAYLLLALGVLLMQKQTIALAARALLGLNVLLALLNLTEGLTGIHWGPDDFFFGQSAAELPFRGAMIKPMAIYFLVTGFIFMLYQYTRSSIYAVFPIILFWAFSLIYAVLVGVKFMFNFDTEAWTGFSFIGIIVHFLLASSLLIRDPEYGPLAPFYEKTKASSLNLKIMAATIGTILILGIISTYFSEQNLISYPFKTALNGSLIVAFVIIFIRGNTRRMNTVEKTLVQQHEDSAHMNLQLKEFTKHIFYSKEKEHRHFSRAVHDDLGQMLVHLRFKMEHLQESMGHASSKAEEDLKFLSRLIHETYDKVVQLSYDIRPPELSDIGIAEALERYSSSVSGKRGIQIFFETDIEDLIVEEEINIMIFRVYQEYLDMMTRELKVSFIRSALLLDGSQLKLVIEDEGDEGGRIHHEDSNHFTFFCIRQRVHMLGGSMEINFPAPSCREAVFYFPVSANTEEKVRLKTLSGNE